MSYHIPRHHCPGLSGTVYVLTFRTRDWRFLLAEIDGVAIWDQRADAGLLGVYQTQELAESIGEAWVYEQQNTRRSYDGDPSSDEEENCYSHTAWHTSSSREDGQWEYKEYNCTEEVGVMVEKCTVLAHVPGHPEDEGEEDENSSGGEESEGNDEHEGESEKESEMKEEKEKEEEGKEEDEKEDEDEEEDKKKKKQAEEDEEDEVKLDPDQTESEDEEEE